MTKSNVALIGLMGTTLALTAFVAINQQSPAEPDADTRLAAIEKRLDGVETLLREVRDTGRSVQRRVETAPRSRAADALPSATAAGSSADGTRGVSEERVAAFEDEVASRVETAVTKKIEQMAAVTRHRGPDGKWKPPMQEMTNVLGLDEAKSEALRQVFDGARDASFELLNEARPEGGSLLDQFATDINESGDIEQSTKRFLGRIATEKRPGTDQTYMNAFFEINERIQARVDDQLDEVGRRRFRELNVDVFEVQTGYDPIGDYIRERLGSQE